MARLIANILFAVIIVGGGGFAFQDTTAATDSEADMTESREDSVEYQGARGGLSVGFRYPSGWKLREETGTIEPYRQIVIQGPRNQDDTYTASLSILAAPLTPEGGKYQSAASLFWHYRNHPLPGTSILDQSNRTVGGVMAMDVTVTYVIPPLHTHGLKPIEIPVKSRTVILQRDSSVYQLTFSADAREYDQHAQAFEQLLQSFRFQ